MFKSDLSREKSADFALINQINKGFLTVNTNSHFPKISARKQRPI